MDKPKFVKSEHMLYLDNLRKSGVTNMFGASSYIQEHFPRITRLEAREILKYWMKTFEARHELEK